MKKQYGNIQQRSAKAPLALSRTTVRALSSSQLAIAVGGKSPPPTGESTEGEQATCD